ncbi:MAG: hypothetical protein IT384_28745 [Deltaproteobacteria bacterium]|nr:hypothetical protein [Deltaproteobacteria bacterium]
MTRLRGRAVCGALLWIFVGCAAPEPSNGLGDAGLAPDAAAVVTRPPTVSPCVSDWPQGPGGWERICAEAPGTHFLSVWGSGPDDVYLVGGRPGRTVVWHFDGSRLAPLEVDGDQRAWWVFGPDRDHVFVAGEGGLLLVREGGGAFRRLDTRTTRTIYGLWARDPDEVFFVTGDFESGARGLVHRWTPVGTSTLSAPALDAFTGAAFFKVWGAGARLWVVGEQGTVMHFDGREWSRLAAPETFSPLLTVSGRNADDVFAVGGRGRGLLEHSAGSAFRALTLPPDTPGIMGVHTATGVPALISGENGLLASVVEDEVRSEGRYTDEPLHAVWQDSIGGAWAVGGNLFAVNREPSGVILRRPAQSCRPDAIARPGYHHLDLQGRGGARRADGTYPMFDMPRGRIAPELQHGEHFLVGPGARVEFTAPLCADIGPEVLFRLPNSDVVGSVVLHQLFVVRGGVEHLVAEAIDDVPGNFGYIPFDRSSLPADELRAISQATTDLEGVELGWSEVVTATAFPSPPRDLLAGPGDTLLFRATNISTETYGLMIWFPQRGLEYQSFIEVRVPVSPGGELPDPPPPPPRPGPCAPQSSARYLEVDLERSGRVLMGPQGSLMLSLTAIGAGVEPGDPSDPLHPDNPAVFASLALDRRVEQGGRLVADGLWRRGLTREGDHLLLELIPSVPPDAIAREALLGSTVHASLSLLDAGGLTLCTEGTFVAHE